MIVFKNYFKIVKSFIPTIIMYSAIFLFFAIFSTQNSEEVTNFTEVKTNIAIINHDENTAFIQSFSDYIKEIAKVVEIDSDEDKLKDALFFREVDYIIVIPKDFSLDFLANKNPKLETMQLPDSYGSVLTENILNRYLNTAKFYVSQNISEEQVVQYTKEDLSKNVEVIMETENKVDGIAKMSYFFNFMNYTLIALCVYIVALIMASFRTSTIRKRNLISAMPKSKFNTMLFLGNLSVVFLNWFAYMIVALILFKEALFTVQGGLMVLNSFIFVISALSIAFLLGNITTKKEAINGIANVLSLGTSFICGAFVPQAYLAASVLNLGKIFPSYWYITNNNVIAEQAINNETLRTIFTNMGIVLIMCIILFAITAIVTNRQKKVA